jgi:hypothetical protein
MSSLYERDSEIKVCTETEDIRFDRTEVYFNHVRKNICENTVKLAPHDSDKAPYITYFFSSD